jgi:phosphoribosyl 1,2-cyclic phosphodiesterase
LKQVVLMHLSHTNNHPEIAYITAHQAMGSHAPQMVLAQQDRATELMEV